jgi:hypothetical protein
VGIAERRQIVRAHLPQVDVSDAHGPRVQRVEPAEHVQQCALADAGRPHHRDHLSLFDDEIEVAQDRHLARADRIALADAARFD